MLSGRTEIGRTDPALLTEEVHGPRLLLLAGRHWRVTHIDWTRRRCFIKPADRGGKALWMTNGPPTGLSYRMARVVREVLLGVDPPVRLTRRARARLAEMRDGAASVMHPGGTVIARTGKDEVRWWTWASFRANATLVATLSDLVEPMQRYDDAYIRLRSDLTWDMWLSGVADAAERICLPEIDDKALAGLKFNTALPNGSRWRRSRPDSPTSIGRSHTARAVQVRLLRVSDRRLRARSAPPGRRPPARTVRGVPRS